MSSTSALGASRRASTSSDHFQIPSYPQSRNVESAPLPSSDTASLAERKPDAKRSYPTFLKGARRLQSQRPDTTSTTASFASANGDASTTTPLATASSSRTNSPRKQAAPARIGRDFEALLASDETYVLRDKAKIALDAEETQDPAAQLLPSSSVSSAKRVIVERRQQQASSSSLNSDLDETNDDPVDSTPQPLQTDVFRSPQKKSQSSASSATLPPSASSSRAAFGRGSQPPASPDRTTSLQRHTSPSPKASSPAPKTMQSFILQPASEQGHGTVRSRPRLGASVGLEQEIDSASGQEHNATDPSASMGSFRQRMKKTSGFLRRLRKDIPPSSKASAFSSSSNAYSVGSNASVASLGRSATSDPAADPLTFRRRGSKASVSSIGASSTTGSASKGQHFASTDGIAVPSIPERFTQPSTSSTSHVLSDADAVESIVSARGGAASGESQQLALQSKPGLRVPSAPVTSTEFGQSTKFALPQRSSSQGHEHERDKSLGTTDSSGAIRLAVQQLSSHMDDAWKDAPAQDVKVAGARDATTPKRSWGPSPQLPDLDIQHDKQRSGSFLEEPELISDRGFDDVQDTASRTVRSVSASSDADIGKRLNGVDDSKHATGLGIISTSSAANMRKKSGTAQHGEDADGSTANGPSEDQNRQPLMELTPLRPTESSRKSVEPSPQSAGHSPHLPNSARSSRRNSIDAAAENARRRTMDSGASLVSVRSFETAAESAGPGSADAKVAAFNMATPNSTQSPSPMAQRDAAKPVAGSTAASPRSVSNQIEVANGSAHTSGASGRETDVEDAEQSIRLVSKRSNTDDINLASDSATTIVTAPKSPEMDVPALPKLSELSESSPLRPGRNGSLSRGGSSTGLLSTVSVHRSSSPVSSLTSARTSFDHAAVARAAATADAGAPPSITASAQELATKCWEEDPSFLKREKIAEWLGGLGLVNKSARTFYFARFDFGGLRLDMAFRKLCDKLFLRAETQQIDRILAAFSQRYYECNPDSVFGSADVVHSVVFSILLLNTDLHIAELQERMTRQQFVRNTLGAIAETGTEGQIMEDERSSLSVAHADDRSADAQPSTAGRRNSISSYLGSKSKQTSTTNLEASVEAAEASRPGSAASGAKGKEAEIETLLKDIYAAVKSERILLPTPESGAGTSAAGRPSGTFSPALGGGRRKMGTDRVTALKRGSIRGIQGLLGGSNGLDGSLSPNPSRTSIDSWGRSSTTAERDRMLSPLPSITPGFASTLSHTIIKESQEEEHITTPSSTKKELPIDEEDDDDQLALAGPPWAKEGSLTRKYYWESTNKRAKDKNWIEVFVVVSKGTLSMFRFDLPSGGAKKHNEASGAAALGGGNWLSSATCLGEISLAHSLANALPPPGYNKTRPYVFALTLPGGKVYLFQTGHEELVNEWVSTCNYWAGRVSKEPLAGGVSNMEYGWNKVLPREEEEWEEELDSFSAATGSGVDADPRGFTQSLMDSQSVRSKFSPAPSTTASVSTSSKLGYMTNERTFINEWRIPELPTLPSTLGEERQLSRLEKQVSSIELQLTQHNDLRQPMLQLYSPKGNNHAKALANWERKSNWLLQELVKYQSYVESLRKSADAKAERRGKREVEEMVRAGDEMLAELEV
ncbi:hypothetical protein PHSY_006890 [Pseudozyma hubeiensis SY62]|uniref:SEC7 domain-containing protein n=1 Tax=Pseudozyma hubeiensis (strain SY62) TaxID=1305764 RepID=R9PD58_PSEHS|nr:hypothetical protein PHSY_006890 [Pseudozyma hubeiensis SY62]GAC99289.1 hypothetical protein PHSY_006890 [Pseudozyma hubeiensis SY62]